MRRPYEARVEGLVEVGLSMSGLSNQARLDVASECYTLVCRPNANTQCQHAHNLSVIPPTTITTTTAVIFLKREGVQVFCDDEMLTEHKMTSVNVMAMVNSIVGTVVYIGSCERNKKRLAVVLNFYTSEAAKGFVNEFNEAKQRTSADSTYVNTEPATPAPQPPSRQPPPETCSMPPQFSNPQPPPPPPPTPVYRRPLPQIPTMGTSEGRPQMLNRPLPPLPTDVPSSDPFYDEIRQYENLDYPDVPPQLPLRYENVQELVTAALSRGVQESVYEDDDWSDDDDDGNLYENDGTYYQTLGFVQEECEQLYMTAKEIDELEQAAQPMKKKEQREEQTNTSEVENKEADSDTSDEEGVVEEEDEEEPLKSPTLEEDVQLFIKGEFQFKKVIWRIRDAKPSLTPDLRNLLKGTETLADIHNDMYIEFYEGYKSCSRIAEVFLSRKDQLERYKYYLLNSPKINKLIQEQDPRVRQRFPKLHQDVQESWKRLHFYLASLEKMMVTAPPSEEPLLKSVVDQLKEMNREGDSSIIMEAVYGAPFSLADHAPLLLHSSFIIRNEQLKDMKSACHLLLFQDVLVLTAPAKDGYQYLRQLPMVTLKLLPSKRNTERSFVLETRTGEKFGVRAASDKKIQLWRQRLKDLIRD